MNTRRLFLASAFHLFFLLVELVLLSYEMRNLSLCPGVTPLSSCQLCLIAKYCQDELPAWIIKFHEISYFAAVLGPSFYPIIFNGTGLLYFQCQVIEKFSY